MTKRSKEMNSLLKEEKEYSSKMKGDMKRLESELALTKEKLAQAEKTKEEFESSTKTKFEENVKELQGLHQREINELKYLLASATRTNELVSKLTIAPHSSNNDTKKAGALKEQIKSCEAKIEELKKVNDGLKDANFKLMQELEHQRFLMKNNDKSTGAFSVIEDEYGGYMERKCKTLTDMAIYWKEQTKLIYEKSRQNLIMIKSELETSVQQTQVEMAKLMEEHTKALLTSKTEYMTVFILFFGIINDDNKM